MAQFFLSFSNKFWLKILLNAFYQSGLLLIKHEIHLCKFWAHCFIILEIYDNTFILDIAWTVYHLAIYM